MPSPSEDLDRFRAHARQLEKNFAYQCLTEWLQAARDGHLRNLARELSEADKIRFDALSEIVGFPEGFGDSRGWIEQQTTP